MFQASTSLASIIYIKTNYT
uniref:Uncharacterized protein n=1 Tax=Timema tahoe TaxID=61484 RepID=A0A7R9IRT5_9NEOP|nr:unnamed protein product [Timema tahoe]